MPNVYLVIRCDDTKPINQLPWTPFNPPTPTFRTKDITSTGLSTPYRNPDATLCRCSATDPTTGATYIVSVTCEMAYPRQGGLSVMVSTMSKDEAEKVLAFLLKLIQQADERHRIEHRIPRAEFVGTEIKWEGDSCVRVRIQFNNVAVCWYHLLVVECEEQGGEEKGQQVYAKEEGGGDRKRRKTGSVDLYAEHEYADVDMEP
ncbi:hypothetical protein BDW02DRAFT_378134 [Decorospora gaudefroyi]|uniref:Uncharacterized protein n=1 Tax=Decorospora gaudefroyi TaxID=184978 RepID=A0A6A5KCI7_9PLEO|nr:hypothetical protein BDW02DRAFT_378134 [Decorospora gaudefroyi]